jgi:hypothetical protein
MTRKCLKIKNEKREMSIRGRRLIHGNSPMFYGSEIVCNGGFVIEVGKRLVYYIINFESE